MESIILLIIFVDLILRLLTGKDGFIVPIISEGRITDVDILNSGSEYTTPPELEVVGVGGTSGTVGQFAKLESVVSDGKITSVNMISSGTEYDANNTIIKVIPSGSDQLLDQKFMSGKLTQ